MHRSAPPAALKPPRVPAWNNNLLCDAILHLKHLFFSFFIYEYPILGPMMVPSDF